MKFLNAVYTHLILELSYPSLIIENVNYLHCHLIIYFLFFILFCMKNQTDLELSEL